MEEASLLTLFLTGVTLEVGSRAKILELKGSLSSFRQPSASFSRSPPPPPISVSWGCRNQVPQTEGFKEQKCIPSGLRWGVSRACLSEGWGAGGQGGGEAGILPASGLRWGISRACPSEGSGVLPASSASGGGWQSLGPSVWTPHFLCGHSASSRVSVSLSLFF